MKYEYLFVENILKEEIKIYIECELIINFIISK